MPSARPARVRRAGLAATLVLVMGASLLPQTSPAAAWSQLPPLPDKLGVAGAFAGVSDGALLVAGGANFPDRMPWEGGTKVWHDTVFVLEERATNWTRAGQLPRPLGYGVSVSTRSGLACLGGSDALRHYADCFLLRWHAGKLASEPLPALPKPCANSCGALVGKTIYVAGGTDTPTATNALHTFWALDLGARALRWRELESWPGPARMLAVAGALDGAFFLFSGAGLAGDASGKPVRRYLPDAYRYTPKSGWEKLPDLPRAVVAAPSPAMACDGQLLVVSGDDGTQVNFEPRSAHPGFPHGVLAFEQGRGLWRELGDSPLSRATASVVEWRRGFVIPSGELRPGVRTPEVWAFRSAR